MFPAAKFSHSYERLHQIAKDYSQKLCDAPRFQFDIYQEQIAMRISWPSACRLLFMPICRVAMYKSFVVYLSQFCVMFAGC